MKFEKISQKFCKNFVKNHVKSPLVIKFLNNGHVENGEKLIFGLLNDAKLVSRLPT